MSLVTVKLYGELGDIIGKTWKLDVNSVGEAIKALEVNTNKVFTYLSENLESKYHVFVDNKDIAEEDLIVPFGEKSTIKIVPVVKGSKGGFFKILVGAALFVAGGGLGTLGVGGAIGGGIGGALGGGVFGTLINTVLRSIGTSLIFGGVSELFFSPPKPTKIGTTSAEHKTSFYFNGAENTTAQGNNVPVCYGRLVVGSAVISAGLKAEPL